MGGASSIGGEDVRPSRDVQSLLIPESHEFIRGSMSKEEHAIRRVKWKVVYETRKDKERRAKNGSY